MLYSGSINNTSCWDSKTNMGEKRTVEKCLLFGATAEPFALKEHNIISHGITQLIAVLKYWNWYKIENCAIERFGGREGAGEHFDPTHTSIWFVKARNATKPRVFLLRGATDLGLRFTCTKRFPPHCNILKILIPLSRQKTGKEKNIRWQQQLRMRESWRQNEGCSGTPRRRKRRWEPEEWRELRDAEGT